MKMNNDENFPVVKQTIFLCGFLLILVLTCRLILQEKVRLAQLDTQSSLQLARGIPTHLSDWHQVETGNIIEVPAEAQVLLNSLYNQQLIRTYENSAGQKVMLSIAYGQDQSNDQSQAHRPEICYVAQGFSLLLARSENIVFKQSRINVQQLVAKQRERNEPITYWMVIGDQVVNPGWKRKLVQLEYAFKRQIPDGLLFRISTISNDNEQAFFIQKQFINDLLTSVDAVTLRYLIGAMPHG